MPPSLLAALQETGRDRRRTTEHTTVGVRASIFSDMWNARWF